MAGTSYTRQSTLTDGDTITASLFNAEYNQLVTAFSYAATGTTGHQHDGGAGEGGNIEIIGDQDFLNKIVVDSSNNRWSVFVEVGGSAVEQVRIEDGVVYPVTDSDVDLGTNALRFKNAYIDSLTATGNLTVGGNITVTGNVDVDGIVEFDGLSGTGSVTVTDILDQDDMSGDSATALATQQSIKAYVDAQQDTVDTFGEVLALSNTTAGTDISVSTDDKVQFRDSAIYINSSADGQLDIVADTEIQIAATTIDINGAINASGEIIAASLDISGNIDVDGVTNLDVVDIDGAVDMASTLTVASNIVVGGTVDGRDVATDGTKLDGIEASATADQSNAEIRTAVEAASDSNVFTDADHSKLNAIEASATADQTDAEIRTAVEAASDSNVFTDADHTKLNAIEASADVTDATNVTAAGALMDSELTAIASVKALNQGVATGDSPTFAALTSTGEITANGGIALGDSDKATFGASDDLQIYHDGSNSWIKDVGTGILDISTNGTGIQLTKNGAEGMINALVDGAVTLYYDNAAKLATASGGITVTGEVAATSLDISGDIDVDGTTNLDVVDIDGAVDMASTLNVSGNLTVGSNIVASTFTVDAGGDINLDANGGDIILLDNNTGFGRFTNSSTDFVIKSDFSNKDLIFKGNDDGSEITALTLDMSAAGAATFNSSITIPDYIYHTSDANTYFGFPGGDEFELVTAGQSRMKLVGSGTTFNEGGNDKDFRVESNGQSYMLFVDGGNNRVGIGGVAAPSDVLQVYSGAAGRSIFRHASGDGGVTITGTGSGSAASLIFGNNWDNDAGSNFVEEYRLFMDGADDSLKFKYNANQSTALTLSNAGAATFTGAVTANAGISVDNITIDGNEIDVSSGDLTLDVAGDIILDADGGDVFFYDAGATFGQVSKGGGSDLIIGSTIADKDIFFTGIDSSTAITAFRLDMSAEGAATFNSSVTTGGLIKLGGTGTDNDSYAINFTNGACAIARDNNDLELHGYNAISFGVSNTSYPSTTERFRIASDGSLSTPTAGTSNVRFGVNAGNSITSGGNYNVVVGDEAGTAITTGDNNVFVGYATGDVINTGGDNVAVGMAALSSDTKGQDTVAIGHQALFSQNFTSATNTYNVAVGKNAGLLVTTGIQNTLIGGLAGDALTDADFNIAIGTYALTSDTLGSRSVAIGRSALGAQNFTSATNTYNVAVGHEAGQSVTTGTINTLIGGLAGDALTTGNSNVAVGYSALSADTKGDRSTAIGLQALALQNFTTNTDAYNTAVGYNAGYSVTTGLTNTLIGGLTGDALTDADYNTAVGFEALTSDTLGNRSVALGYFALRNQNFTSATDSYNTALGFAAGEAVTTGVQNTLIGGLAGDALTTGHSNTALGYNSLSDSTTAVANTALGHSAGADLTTGDRNVLVGNIAGASLTTADDATLIGYGAGGGAILTGHDNVGVGTNALNLNTSGASNVAVGRGALEANTTASNNTAVGYKSLLVNTTGAQNVAIGAGASDANTTGSFNTSLGDGALGSDTTGGRSVALGYRALETQNFTDATASYNVAIGFSAGNAVTTGIYNTLVGGLAGDALTDADRNVALGYGALGACQLGSRNTAVGFYALEVTNPSSAVNTQNTALGHSAGRHISTGTHNVCIGTDSGLATNLTTGSGNVVVGNFAHTSAYNSQYANGFGYDINAESGYTTLGKAADDIRAAHGNVTWATVSDQRYKKDIVDSTAGLSFINALQPRTFKYKTLGELPETFSAYEADSTEVFKNSNTNHGFIAQEVKAAIDADSSIKDGFRLWDDRDDGSQEVAEAALIPILVKAIQELTARIETLEG